MPTRIHEMQNIIKLYKTETGETEVDMHKIAEYALKNGWPLPKPVSAVDLLARQFTDAARVEMKIDEKSHQPYRVNHAIPANEGTQGTLWIDIDEAPRTPMHKSLIMRRQQIVDDSLQVTLDADHWNNIHPNEQPIQIPLDFTEDVEERKHD